MRGEDFHDSLRTDAHDEANQSSLAALDAEEARAAVAVALDVLDDAGRALTLAEDAYAAALTAFNGAREAEARS